MIVLDSDHLRILQSRSPQSHALEARLVATNDPIVATTIVSVEEGLRGWLAEIHKRPVSEQIPYYERLQLLLTYFSQWTVLPFDEAAAVEYERLRRRRIRSIGTMDMKIAAIVLRHRATLLSANLQHFRLIPELDVQDWIHIP
jgi:tRNA(fMet)-specific endonuclease VapC